MPDKNVRAGVVTTQWGRAGGTNYRESFRTFPITKNSDVLYRYFTYNKQIKVDYQGVIIKEIIDRGQWINGMICSITKMIY